jgi:hypothetical protein
MPFKPFDWLYTMTYSRWRRSSSSSTRSPPRPPPTIDTRSRSSTTRHQRSTDANSHSTSSSTATNSQSSASVTALAPEQAVLATSRALAHAHLAPSTTTNDDYASTTVSVVPEVLCAAMTTQNEGSEECAPAPAVAQVAPTSPATTDSQLRTQTPPQPEQSDLVSHTPITTVDVEIVSQPQEDVRMDSQSQDEEPVNHMTPPSSATSPSARYV